MLISKFKINIFFVISRAIIGRKYSFHFLNISFYKLSKSSWGSILKTIYKINLLIWTLHVLMSRETFSLLHSIIRTSQVIIKKSIKFYIWLPRPSKIFWFCSWASDVFIWSFNIGTKLYDLIQIGKSGNLLCRARYHHS